MKASSALDGSVARGGGAGCAADVLAGFAAGLELAFAGCEASARSTGARLIAPTINAGRSRPTCRKPAGDFMLCTARGGGPTERHDGPE